MPFALDILYCRLPSADWPYDRPLPAGAPVGELSGTLGSSASCLPPPASCCIGRLGDLSSTDRTAPPALSAAQGYLLGPEEPRPALHDLCGPGAGRPQADLLLLCPARGPAAADLAAVGAAARWHYYIDRGGRITRLCDEGAPTRVSERIGRRAVVLACEGDLPGQAAQRAALAWLVRALIIDLRVKEVFTERGEAES